MLDQDQPITPSQSVTIRACVLNIVASVVPIVAIITGKTFDIAIINEWVNAGVTGLFSALSIYYSLRAIQGRINATETIKTK